MLDTLQEIYGAVMRNKMRTVATGFAVASGLFLIIVLQGAGNGIIHTFEYNMGQFAFDAVRVFGGWTSIPYEGIKEGRRIRLDQRDVDMSRTSFSDKVTDAMPSVSTWATSVNYGKEYLGSTELKGVYPEFAQSQAVQVMAGRFINEIDLLERRKVAVISTRAATDLFQDETRGLGNYLCMDGINYRVVGIYKVNEMSMESEMYIPFTTIAAVYNKGAFLDEVLMNVRPFTDKTEIDSFIDDYRRASSHIHSFAPDDRRALQIWNQAEDSAELNMVSNTLHTAFWILGLLTLISGIVGVSNIMLISVKERTREFGIRRAIGARPWGIIRMVMLESVLITAFFGYIGMLLGIFFCEYMDSSVGNQTMDIGIFKTQYFIDPTVDLSVCVTATFIIIVAGALAGFFPARRAVKVKPIDALRG